MEEKRIPSLLLNILLTQVDEMMGRRSLIMLLRQAGLAEYVDNVPPMDDTPSIILSDAEFVQQLNAAGYIEPLDAAAPSD